MPTHRRGVLLISRPLGQSDEGSYRGEGEEEEEDGRKRRRKDKWSEGWEWEGGGKRSQDGMGWGGEGDTVVIIPHLSSVAPPSLLPVRSICVDSGQGGPLLVDLRSHVQYRLTHTQTHTLRHTQTHTHSLNPSPSLQREERYRAPLFPATVFLLFAPSFVFGFRRRKKTDC